MASQKTMADLIVDGQLTDLGRRVRETLVAAAATEWPDFTNEGISPVLLMEFWQHHCYFTGIQLGSGPVSCPDRL